MDKHELLSAIAEMIANNSDIGAEPDDPVLLDGVEDVMENVGPDGAEDVTVLFTDGTAFRVTAERTE